MYASPVFAGGSSISNSTTNSPSASESWPGPVTTSATGMVRSPSVPAITARLGGDHRRDAVSGGRAVAEVPAEARAILDLIGTDPAGPLRDAGEDAGELTVAGEFGGGHGRTDGPVAVVVGDRHQSVDALQVDQHRGLRATRTHLGNDVGSPRTPGPGLSASRVRASSTVVGAAYSIRLLLSLAANGRQHATPRAPRKNRRG